MLPRTKTSRAIGLHLSARAGRRAWLAIIGFTVWAMLVTVAERYGLLPGRISPVPFTFIGLPLGFFLAFRGNQGYARYWEARHAWTVVCNSARNFARQVTVYNNPTGDADPAELKELTHKTVQRTIAYVYAVRASLVGGDVEATAAKYLDIPVEELNAEGTYLPYAILHSISTEVERGMKKGLIDRLFVRVMDNQLAALNDAAGTCEKIRSTPLPVPLVLITSRMLFLYIAGLPIGIVDVTYWFTPIVVGIIAFAFLGLNFIGGELSAPFAEGPNQLPLLTTSRKLERDLRSLVDEPLPTLPPPGAGGTIP